MARIYIRMVRQQNIRPKIPRSFSYFHWDWHPEYRNFHLFVNVFTRPTWGRSHDRSACGRGYYDAVPTYCAVLVPKGKSMVSEILNLRVFWGYFQCNGVAKLILVTFANAYFDYFSLIKSFFSILAILSDLRSSRFWLAAILWQITVPYLPKILVFDFRLSSLAFFTKETPKGGRRKFISFSELF